MLTFFGVSYLGLILISAGLGVVAFRYAMAARSGSFVPPITVNPGAAMKAIQEALEGNKAAALTALGESFHLDVAAGSIEQKLLSAGFAELERRAADPNAKMPAVDYIAHFSGRSRDDVIKFLEAEAGVSTAPPAPILPAAATVAAALLLCLCLNGSASAKSPIRIPDRWEPTRQEIQIDPAVFHRPVSIAQRGEILLPDSQYVSLHRESIYPTNFQPCYQPQQAGFWQRGPARRWLSNRGGWIRNGNHPILRFLFRRRG